MESIPGLLKSLKMSSLDMESRYSIVAMKKGTMQRTGKSTDPLSLSLLQKCTVAERQQLWLALRSGCATSFSVALSPTEKAAASLMEPLEREREAGRCLVQSLA